MRVKFVYFLFCFGFIVTSCSEESDETSETTDDNTEVDSLETEETDEFEAKYAEVLSAECDCETEIWFDVSGEGDLNPVEILVDGESTDCYSWEGSASKFDPESGLFTINELDEETEVVDGQLLQFKSMDRIKSPAGPGSIYLWPDAESEVVGELKYDSGYQVIACFNDWVKVQYRDYDNLEDIQGWFQKK